MSFCGSWASSDVGVSVEFYGGPRDGERMHIPDAPSIIRLADFFDKPLHLLTDEEVLDGRADGALISCYHRRGNGPYWGVWRYDYHGTV